MPMRIPIKPKSFDVEQISLFIYFFQKHGSLYENVTLLLFLIKPITLPSLENKGKEHGSLDI